MESSEEYKRGFRDGHRCCEILKTKAEDKLAELELELNGCRDKCAQLEQMYNDLYVHHANEKHSGELIMVDELQSRLSRYEKGVEVGATVRTGLDDDDAWVESDWLSMPHPFTDKQRVRVLVTAIDPIALEENND